MVLQKTTKNYRLKFYKPSVPIDISYIKNKHDKELKCFDTNLDGYLDFDEIADLNSKVLELSGKDNKLDQREIDGFAKKINTNSQSLKSFLYCINGYSISAKLYRWMGGGKPLSLDGEFHCIKIMNTLNKKNVAYALRYYKERPVRETLLDDLISQIGVKKFSVTMLQQFMNTCVDACNDQNIDVKEYKQKFDEALKEYDKEGVKRYGNLICDYLLLFN